MEALRSFDPQGDDKIPLNKTMPGDSPYSIAITLCEALGDMRGWDIKILAADISTLSPL